MQYRILSILLATCCALLVATGCGGGHSDGAPVASSGIHGLTRERIEGGAVPLTPRPPTIEPLPNVALTVQRVGIGHELTRQQSDATGHFQIILPPGTYVVGPLRPDANPGLVPPPNQTVVVRDGSFTDVNFTYILEAP